MATASDAAHIVVIGPVLQCVRDRGATRLALIPRARVVADARSGTILSVDALPAPSSPIDDDAASANDAYGDDVVVLRRGQFLVPGLVDTHNHALQTPLAGKALDAPLDEWLRHYTFPLENKASAAPQIAQRAVSRSLANGTTTALYFATRHVDASMDLVDACIATGQRAMVGVVSMDVGLDGSNSTVTDTDRVVADARRFIEVVHARGSPLAEPVITPRFAPVCSSDLLTRLGQLSQEMRVFVQSHACESDWETDWGPLHYGGMRDFDIFKLHGLISEKNKGCLFAHCVHANSKEISEVLADPSVGVSHCPLSNVFFANGILPAKAMMDAGLNIGLGTDIGGAYSHSILHSCRTAIASSRILRDGTGVLRGGHPTPHAQSALSHLDAFWMATVGGAKALGKDSVIGTIQPGFQFDALVVDVDSSGSTIDTWWDTDFEDSLPELFEKWIMLGDDRNIVKVWVNGKLVRNLDRQV
ncbi:hypothetical protein HDU84_009765 [Entophlyctis sp. JEL0112]|nr:hypothetical protein HDU84_009765 [Entophlyctis sp. JEL0112]